MTDRITGPAGRAQALGGVTLPLVGLCGVFFIAFFAYALVDLTGLTKVIDSSFAWSIRVFGFYWQILTLVYFILAWATAVMPGSKAKLGGLDKPEFSTFKWGAMIMCTLIASGGVFWAAGEPIAHFTSPPPYFGDDPGGIEAAYTALAQTYMHWGFVAWGIYGSSLTAIVLLVCHYEKGLPLAPRTILYPLLGRRAIEAPIGTIVDACVLIAVIAGICGPIGFLALQVGYGLNALLDIPDGFATHATIIAVLFVVVTVSAVTGIGKGIQYLSRANVMLALALLLFLLAVGPTWFVIEGYLQGMLRYAENVFGLALYREHGGMFSAPGWEASWTLFFWAWGIGWAPLAAVFMARISRGRSARELVLMTCLVAPIGTTLWFTVLGGTGLALDLADPGAVTGPFVGDDLPAALLAVTRTLPFGLTVSLLFLLLSTTFIITTGDSTSYAISVVAADKPNPSARMRIFWSATLSATALVLVYDGPAAIGNIQSLIVVTAVPVSFFLLPSLWYGPRMILAKAKTPRS
jgi:choline-glycine betaine transporter